MNMNNQNNIYGLLKENTHLIKNSEWAAVAYLSNSEYGINSQITKSTGTQTGNSVSTTNNITGIYDMSGVKKEFVNPETATENDLGQALIETKTWYNDTNTYRTSQNMYLTRGNTSITNYNYSGLTNSSTTFRTSITNVESKEEYKPQYLITFDPNGGTVGETTKTVTYGETYGSLPTPTRSGYTFMGWRGKKIKNTINQGVKEIKQVTIY